LRYVRAQGNIHLADVARPSPLPMVSRRTTYLPPSEIDHVI